MVARPRLATALLTLGVLAAVGYLFYLAVIERRAFLPGPVHASHAHLEHDCEACHDSFSGVSNAKCAACHVDASGAALAWGKGFKKHHADATLDCASCHTDHKGRRGDTTTIAADAYLASCEKCHAGYEKTKGTFQGLAVWDHKDHTPAKEVPGKGALRCEQCHDARPSERAHHGQVTIARLDCFSVACHVAPLKKEKGFALGEVHAKHAAWKNDCFACHTWLGKIDSGKCASCHDDGKGGNLVLTGFASHHARADLDCARCHTEHQGAGGTTLREPQADYAASCNLCHAGYEKTPRTIRGDVFVHTSHGEKQKLACADCHDMRRDAPSHAKVTLAENACVACHMKRDHPERTVVAAPWREVTAAHAPIEKDCARCHAAAADTRGSLCADCHKMPQGRQVAWQGFARHHLDPTLDCAKCHGEHRGRVPATITTMTQEAYADSCSNCHAAYASFVGEVNGHVFRHKGHTPQEKLRCEQCHDIRVDARGPEHGKLTVALEKCTTCHLKKDPEIAVGALAKGHAAVADCAACHKDWHAPDPTLCVACHRLEADKKSTLAERHVDAGAAAAAPARLFPGHATDARLALDCLGCHTDHKGATSTERLPKEPVTRTCERCHAAPGGGEYVQTAERSPHRLAAGDPLARQPAEDTFAHRQHTSVACEQCHAADVKRHARAPKDAGLPLALKPGDCIACHHAPGQQQKKCAECHEAESRFRGGGAAGVTAAAPADAHVGLVDCADCHVPDARGGFASTRAQCVRCHGEDFGKLYDAERGALAAAISSRAPKELGERVRRYGMHNARLAELLLSPDAPRPGGR